MVKCVNLTRTSRNVNQSPHLQTFTSLPENIDTPVLKCSHGHANLRLFLSDLTSKPLLKSYYAENL